MGKKGKTDVYLFVYHSDFRDDFNGCKDQYETVERAISGEPWPYDNGDDPSFWVANHGGRLTWGVCRQDSRNPLPAPALMSNGDTQPGAIAVFFSNTQDGDRVRYRLCAVATVEEKLDHRAPFRDVRLKDKPYINTMIKWQNGRWRYDESDRPRSHRHKDWLWRMCDHKGIKQKKFNSRYRKIRKRGWFADEDVERGRVVFARNYVLFSGDPAKTYIAKNPPEVAVSKNRKSERWSIAELKELIIGRAKKFGGRGYLRVENKSNRNVHRPIHFHMDTAEAEQWRADLIRALQQAERKPSNRGRKQAGKGKSKSARAGGRC